MPILNYTTEVPAEKTLFQIQRMLAKAGAKAVLIEYDDDGVSSALSFRMKYKEQMISFRLPANIDAIYVVLQRTCQPRFCNLPQAGRVAWRIIKDWVEAQLAIVEAEQAEMVEIFLPYAQNPTTGETLFEQLERTDFKLLEAPS